jgi:hypothetical protein
VLSVATATADRSEMRKYVGRRMGISGKWASRVREAAPLAKAGPMPSGPSAIAVR